MGEPLPRSVLLSVMKAAATMVIAPDEIADRRYKGLAAGEQLKVVFALAQTEPKRASWTAATRPSGPDRSRRGQVLAGLTPSPSWEAILARAPYNYMHQLGKWG